MKYFGRQLRISVIEEYRKGPLDFPPRELRIKKVISLLSLLHLLPPVVFPRMAKTGDGLASRRRDIELLSVAIPRALWRPLRLKGAAHAPYTT